MRDLDIYTAVQSTSHRFQEVAAMALLMKPEPFSTEFDRLFNQLFDRSEAARRWVPAMDLVEHDDHFVMRADLPGMSEGDVSIEVRDNTLTLTGERQAEHEE